MVGQKLANRLAGDASWTGKINELILYDVVSAQKPGAAFAIKTMTGSLADASQSQTLAALKPDLIFHLAAIVSGDAEKNFEKGWYINARGFW